MPRGSIGKSTMVRRAADWLLRIQNEDGGWGEDGASYKLDYKGYEPAPSTASQTAWALLGLMAAGEVDHPQVQRGIRYLLEHQTGDGLWDEERFTATGFPRVFYLRYHGYRKFFPLWARGALSQPDRGQRPPRRVRHVGAVSMTPHTPALLVVTGLQREAQIAAGDGVITLCSGGRSAVALRESPDEPSRRRTRRGL